MGLFDDLRFPELREFAGERMNMNRETVEQVRGMVRARIMGMVDTGEIHPDNADRIFVSVRMDIPERSLDVHAYPMRDRRWVHDCGDCKYLGSDECHDYYHCCVGNRSTLLARAGDDGPDYRSTSTIDGRPLGFELVSLPQETQLYQIPEAADG